MELHGNFQPHLQQKWLVREYNSCGLEYILGPYKWTVPRGLNGSMCPIIGINCKEVKYIILTYFWYFIVGPLPRNNLRP